MSPIALAAVLLAAPQGPAQTPPQEPAPAASEQPASAVAQEPQPQVPQGSGPIRRPQREPNVGVDPASAVVPWTASPRRAAVSGEQPESLEELTEWVSGDWTATVHGYLRTSYLVADDPTATNDNAGFSFDALRLFIDASAGEWHFHTGVRGDRGQDLQPYGESNSSAILRMPEMWAMYDFAEGFHFRVGRFRTPLLTSAMMEETGMVLYNRSFQGRLWERDRYQSGVQVDGQIGDFRGWFAVQNGEDQIGENLALTLKGQWDVVGGGTPQQYQGAYGAPDYLAATVGGALHYDALDDNYSAQVLEGRMTLGRYYIGYEGIDLGNGLFNDVSSSLIASAMLTDTIELAAGYENVTRPERGELWRVGATWYIEGRNAKLQATYNTSDIATPVFDGDAFIVGLTVGF